MTLMRISLLLLSELMALISSQDIRSFHMSIMFGQQFQCVNTTCLPFTTVITSSIRQCQISCLSKSQCQAAAFHQSTSYCELFINIPNQNGNMMLANADTTNMIVMDGTRIPSVSDSLQETTEQNSAVTTQQSTLLPITTACSNTLTLPTGRAPTISWYFENNLNDYFGIYNGTGQNNPTYQLGRNGCGKCLNLSSSLHQSVIVNAGPYIALRTISFSVEACVKPMIVTDGLEHVVLTQCGALQTQQCMRVSIGNPGKMSFLFRSDNQLGNRTIPVNVWSHFAYVYDLPTRTMSLYYNGSLDASMGNHGPYQGVPTSFQIGNVNAIGSIYFDGCIDQIFFYLFARTAMEISTTAALG